MKSKLARLGKFAYGLVRICMCNDTETTCLNKLPVTIICPSLLKLRDSPGKGGHNNNAGSGDEIPGKQGMSKFLMMPLEVKPKALKCTFVLH